jgi:hypothetical protein
MNTFGKRDTKTSPGRVNAVENNPGLPRVKIHSLDLQGIKTPVVDPEKQPLRLKTGDGEFSSLSLTAGTR